MWLLEALALVELEGDNQSMEKWLLLDYLAYTSEDVSYTWQLQQQYSSVSFCSIHTLRLHHASALKGDGLFYNHYINGKLYWEWLSLLSALVMAVIGCH